VPNSKLNWLLFIATLIVILVSAIFWLQKIKPAQPKANQAGEQKFHLAFDPQTQIKTVKIKAFYFVPSQTAPEDQGLWKSQLGDGLKQTARFYGLQLDNALNISWDIYPEAVIGEQPKDFYDTPDTNNGNPHALISIREELLRRFFSQPKTDFDRNFAKAAPNEYEVMAIFYEGLGSSATLIAPNPSAGQDVIALSDGQPPAFLVSRYFFTASSYQDYYGSIFAHEFGHILGLSDSFNLDNGQVQDSDIMGSGRFRPLAITYLSLENKQKLGLGF
jgi:hypothetical protein